ncbi:MAG: hypothetical protein JWP89_7125 [Schlesneria sp.]|nr:hypothetical protein [Schlesneria sp.]
MKDTNEFSEKTKKNLMLRAAHRCSLPNCRKLTIRPHSDGVNAVITGRAAHICGKAPNSARYLATQTPEERSSQSNGIWVCGDDHDGIDKDELKYPVEVLLDWKAKHELWVGQEDLVPKLPWFKLTTFNGLALPSNGSFSVSGSDNIRFRDHELTLTASSRHELVDLHLRIQFPERIVSCEVGSQVAGNEIYARPDRIQFVASFTGGGQVERIGELPPTNLWVITIARLLTNRPICLRLRSIEFEESSSFQKSITGRPDHCYTHIIGKYLYEDRQQYFEREFVAVITVDKGRSFAIHPSEEPGIRPLIVSHST